MPKTEMKAKRSTRKPLRDVSNSTKPSKLVLKKNKTLENDNDSPQLDRLILIHSDLSSILHQVDELVAKALKAPSKIGWKEIESLTQVLSEIQSSLKPWPLRFQKALSAHSNGSENHLNPCVASETVHVDEHLKDVVQSPEKSTMDSLISPSPLVSWRGESKVDGGRQLFLLTPLPRPKAFSSNPRAYLKSEFEKFKSDNGFQSLLALSNDTNDNPLGDRETKAMPAKVSDLLENKRESTVEPEIASPPKSSQKDCSLLVFTPRMKMSPPKSCVLLEPIYESTHKSHPGVRKSTPFPVGLKGSSVLESSESSSSGETEDLSLKYPELFGIQNWEKGNRRKVLESSPEWFMSPPKSCVLMEPSDEKLLTDAMKSCRLSRTANMPDQLKNAPVQTRDDGSTSFNGLEFGDSYYAVVESTPMMKEEPRSTLRAGKRPGENTLKKELWTKFEAASTHGVRFDVSVLQTARKGFMDRLEEVSSDETNKDN